MGRAKRFKAERQATKGYEATVEWCVITLGYWCGQASVGCLHGLGASPIDAVDAFGVRHGSMLLCWGRIDDTPALPQRRAAMHFRGTRLQCVKGGPHPSSVSNRHHCMEAVPW